MRRKSKKRNQTETKIKTLWIGWKQAEKNFNQTKKIINNKKLVNLKFKKRTILFGAGPSTKKAVNRLKNKDLSKVTICACDTILGFLLENNIRVDYCFTVDYQPDFNVFKNIDSKNITLCAYAGSSYLNIKNWKGKFFMFDIYSDDNIKISKYKRFLSGYNVYNAAVSIIRGHTKDPILLIGNDCCFKDKVYFHEWEKDANEWIEKNISDQMVKVGNKKTMKQYAKSWKWLENMVLKGIFKRLYVIETGLFNIFPIANMEIFIS